MSGRRISVDLGPLHLSLLEGGASAVSGQELAARAEDVLKLRSLMRQGSGAYHARGATVADEDAGGDCSASSEAGAAGMTDGPGAMSAAGMDTLDEAKVGLLAFELSAALQVAQMQQARKTSELRLALRPTVVRDAELGVVDRDGTLEFSLWVGNDGDCQWLAMQLPRLARCLGERLRRRLRLRLFEGLRQQQLLAEQAWPPEAGA